MMRTSCQWPSLKAMVFGLGLCLALSATTTTSHAIPVAGDYVFTSGLTGSFTSNGLQLTNWNIGQAGSATTFALSSPSSGVTQNNDINFQQTLPVAVLTIEWPVGQALFIAGDATFLGPFTFQPSQAVPEPSSLVLVGLGLLALYGWRHRRQAGLQVG